MRKKSKPLMEVHLFGPRGVVIGDGRARSVPLACDKRYDVTLGAVSWDGSLTEVAARRDQPSAWKRLISALRG
jgi:hypothetical protein